MTDLRRLLFAALCASAIGCAQTPVLLGDVVAGSGSSHPQFVAGTGSTMLFRISNASGSPEVWTTNGTPATTARRSGINCQIATSLGDGLLLFVALPGGAMELVFADANGDDPGAPYPCPPYPLARALSPGSQSAPEITEIRRLPLHPLTWEVLRQPGDGETAGADVELDIYYCGAGASELAWPTNWAAAVDDDLAIAGVDDAVAAPIAD